MMRCFFFFESVWQMDVFTFALRLLSTRTSLSVRNCEAVSVAAVKVALRVSVCFSGVLSLTVLCEQSGCFVCDCCRRVRCSRTVPRAPGC